MTAHVVDPAIDDSYGIAISSHFITNRGVFKWDVLAESIYVRPGLNKCGQAGDLGQVGLHQLSQVIHELTI